MRTEPNIIITGTPGVGKTSHCTLLASATGLKHLSINQIVKDRECHEGWDEDHQSWIVDEDKVRQGRTFQFSAANAVFVLLTDALCLSAGS
jgi:adenylate kinase